jgi:hypothetical protein
VGVVIFLNPVDQLVNDGRCWHGSFLMCELVYLYCIPEFTTRFSLDKGFAESFLLDKNDTIRKTPFPSEYPQKTGSMISNAVGQIDQNQVKVFIL